MLFERFGLVNHVYGAVLDAKVNQPVFRAEAHDADMQMRYHIKLNCLVDPPGTDLLYFKDGEDSVTDEPKIRCVRGRNGVGEYHFHLRSLSSSFMPPKTTHYLLQEQNHRWNLGQVVKNRGLDPSLVGF